MEAIRLSVTAACAFLTSVQLLRLCAAYARARRRRRLPFDAALLLGGDEARERIAAAMLAGTAPPAACVALAPGATALLRACAVASSLPVVVSSAALRGAAPFVAAGIAAHRVTADDTATDTVSNFTTAAPLLAALHAQHVLVLTSARHASRASAVAALTLGARGVGATVVPLRSSSGGGAAESRLRTLRDAARALLWALTGVHGGALGRLAHPERFRHLDARWRA